MEGVAITSERAPTRCPYCKDGFDPGKEVVACAPCGARQHAACHAAHGRCAACGATDVLVPARRRPRRELPPTGSRIRVEQADGRTTYEWDPRTRNDLVLAALMTFLVITIPIAIIILLQRRRHTSMKLVVTPDQVELTAHGGLFGKRVQARRDEVGAIRVQALGEQSVHLSLDVGIERHLVMTGIMGAGLKAPEMEWLAEQLCAWRDEA